MGRITDIFKDNDNDRYKLIRAVLKSTNTPTQEKYLDKTGVLFPLGETLLFITSDIQGFRTSNVVGLSYDESMLRYEIETLNSVYCFQKVK